MINVAGGDTPQNVIMGNNMGKYKNIIKTRCTDYKNLNVLIGELQNFKRKGRYNDFVFEIKQKLFPINALSRI